MKTRPKVRTLSSPNLSASFANKQNKSTALTTKNLKQAAAISKPTINDKQKKKTKDVRNKQNVQSLNAFSPQDALKGKKYKPKLKKGVKLQLSQNTVSLVINQSSSSKKHDLLDSLLYGDVDLSYVHQLNSEQHDTDELLIDNHEQANQNSQQLKNYRNLSPIKSISEYSVNQNQDQLFIVQKVNNKSGKVVLKIRNNATETYKKKMGSLNVNCILLNRLLVYFVNKTEELLKLYYAIYKSLTKKQMHLKIREFLFRNSIIFNKTELNQLMDNIYQVLDSVKVSNNFQQLNEQKIQILFQMLFFQINQNNGSLSQDLWLNEQIVQRLFFQKQTASIWQLLQQISSQAPQQLQSSFRKSRFCLSLDSSMFVSEVDSKRKKQNTELISKWLCNYIKPATVTTFAAVSQQNNFEIGQKQIKANEFKINIFSPHQ